MRLYSTLPLLPVLALVVGLLGACSPLRLVNGAVPTSARPAELGLPYGASKRQTFDVYKPAHSTGKDPVVIFFYGGSWQSGDKSDYLFVADAFTSKGFITIIPDYRVYPEVKFPLFLRDGAAVVRWAKDHVDLIGGDSSRIFLVGHSAGAHIAAMLCLDGQYLAEYGLDRSAVRGMVGLSGPYDFLPFHSDTLRTLFGPPEQWPDTQPINHVDGKGPPMLLMTGTWDTKVGPGNTRRLLAKLCENGGTGKAIYYRGIGHVMLIGTLSRPFRFLAPTLRDATDFMDGLQ